MTELETMLRASVDLIEKDKQIAALKEQLAAKDKRIAALEGNARRSTPPFDTPALLRPQA
jgi:hypothetical protein